MYDSHNCNCRRLWLVIASLLFLSVECISQTVNDTYEIAPWQGFRSAAISYTFDDNCPNQLGIAVPMFDQFGYKLTLFTVTSPTWGWKADWSGLQKAASEGHEIASHTVTHANFSTLADSAQKTELESSQDTINVHIAGQRCITIAYPYCATGNSAMVANYYLAARGCSGQVVSKTPADFMNISSFVCGNQGLNTSTAMESKADEAASVNGWCVYLMHGINGTEPGAYSPISQDTILATLQYMKNNPQKFWVAPFGTVTKYIRERNSASVSESSSSADSVVVQVTDKLGSGYFDVPLTIRRPLPEKWDSILVLQNGGTMSSWISGTDTARYAVFEAVPNGGNVTIVGKTRVQVGVRSLPNVPSTFALYQNYPNPFNPTTRIGFRIADVGFVSLKVYDTLGREVATLVNRRENPGYHTVSFNAAGLSSGVYFYAIQAGSFNISRRMVLIK